MARLKKLIILSLLLAFLFSVTGSYLFSAKAQSEHEELMIDQKKTIEENQKAANVETANAGTAAGSFSMEDVIKASITENSQLKALSYLIETKAVDLREKKETASRISEEDVKSLELAKVKYFLPYDAETQLQIAKLDKEEKENEISIDAIHAYMDLMYFKEAIKVLEAGVKRAEEQVNIARLNYEVGTITKADVLSSEVQLEKTKSELDQAKNQLKIKSMQLNQVMNRSLEAPLSLKDIDLTMDVPLNEEAVEKGLEYNLSMKKQKLELQSLDKLLEITNQYFPKKTYVYQSVESGKMMKQATLDETKTKVELGLKSQQILIDSLLHTYQVMQQQVKKVSETYQISLLQYKSGFISYQELANNDQLMKQTGLEELQAKLDYFKAVFEYKYMLGLK